MKTKLIDRYGSASLRAELPLAPHVEIANLARRSCSILHLRDRWKFVGKALLLALVAFALLFAGVLTHNDILVVCAFLAFAAAFALAIRLSPTRLEAQVGQTEGDIEKAVSAFDAECQNAALSFAATAVMAAKDEAQGLVRDGASFAALGEWREATRDGFHNLESDSAATLSACQEAVNNCRTDLQRQRKCLAGAGRGPKAQFIPGAARRAARDAISAAVRLGEARIEEAMTKAQVHAYHSIAERVRNISCGDSVEMTTATGPALESPPIWLGTSLPPTEELEAEAERLVADNITAIRAKLIESEDKDALTTEVKQLLTNSSPGPHSVEEYVAGLNGDGAEWAERVLREATPFAPVSPIAGKPRFRKLLAMTSNGSDSAVFRNIREALSDQALHIVARDHPQSDVLCLEDEWGLCAGEFPEVAELIKEFRSLPPEEQALLCTACDASELRNFFPELPEDHTRPPRLLASARVFDVIQRSGNYNDETKRATKATIFTERTIHHRQPVESVGTPKEALLVTLNECGCVDLDRMAGLLNKPVEEFLPDLKGIIFRNPQTNEWETDDQYLSGNVREKLAVADAAALTDPRFAENVEALKSVQPADLAAGEIDVRLGSAWLPPEDVKDFTNQLLNIPSGVEVGHIHALGTWHINANWEAKGATANTTDWGTDRYTALELIEDALNVKTPTVHDTVDDKPVVNAQATEAAREKQERIKEKFKEWVWSEDARRERLCRLYNDTFNHTRIRTFNGDHLTLPGASGAIQLHGHQKAGVWRILQTPNTLLAHVVGAGKTFTMVAAALELKRLGLARKPMFSVPNHMLGQFSTELLTLYPGANILVAGKEDFESQNRKKLFSRIATGNWDAVIVTHSGFERIPLARETQERFFEEQLHELEMIKRQHADSSNRRLVKEIEKAKKRLEAKLQALAAEHKKDNTLTFEELGVDRIFVDEAHYFKNLFYVTKMTRIAGLPQTASERAFDMYLKVRHVQSLNGGGGVVFATGTPIANSMAEMFTMQRYLQPDELKKHNLNHFDSWAATFGEPVTAMELSPDGAGYRLNTRFARFINVPELMQMFRQSADVQTAAMLNLPRPKLDGEKPAIRNAPATEELKEFVQELAARAERMKTGRIDPREDNMLKITSEGRKAALDLRLMFPSARDEPQGKVNLAVENIHRIWQATASDRSTQLVFCDLSTPKDKGFSVYRDVAEKLKGMGIPEREIAFIQDFDSDASKLALFRDVRSGKVRILFGSTQKMGSGTNVQERLIALHHLDAPWRPADVEQREGRILRQGNKNSTVQVYRYVTEGSFDAYMWQTLETKAKFIAQVMCGDMTIRRLEDLDSAALTYAEVKAIASGNPLVIEKAQVDAELMRLTRLRSAHAEEQYRIRSNLRRSHEDAEMFTGRLTNLRQDITFRQDTSGDKFTIELDGQEINNRGIAGELILRRAEKLKNRFGDDIRIGRLAGFDLFLRPSFNDTVEVVLRGRNSYAARVTDTALGTIRSLEATIQGFEERAGKLEADIADAQKRTKELETKIGATFEKEDRYQQLSRRQNEIEDQLDLTKNQAPSQVETESNETVEHKTSEGHTHKNHRPRAAQRAAVRI